MKKTNILITTALTIMLLFTSCSSNGSEKKLIEDIDFGTTINQVIEALDYSDDYYNKFDDLLEYKDIKLFGQYCERASFNFKNNELDYIIIYYPSGADSKVIIKSLEKSYGKNEDSFDDHKSFSWYCNGASISLIKSDEDGPCILISKDKSAN